jgi:Spy/CpxP family protein refolding chaperone
MCKRVLVLVSAVAFLTMTAAATPSMAQSNPGKSSASLTMQGAVPGSGDSSGKVAERRHHGPSLRMIMEKLGISDAQKKQIRALYVAFRDGTRNARTELRSLKDEKRTMLLSGKIDQQKLAQIDEQIVKLVGNVMREKLKLQRDRLALLTPEQLSRVADWQAERAFHEKWKRMHCGRLHHDRGWLGRFGG